MVTAHTNPDSNAVTAYVKKFGFEEKERHERRIKILETQLQTEARKAFSVYNAYDVYQNQDKIQSDLFERMKKIGQDELFLVIESVQFGNWHFEDPQVEKAASAVVAAQKLREAEQASFEAAKIKQQTQQLQAQVYSDPRMFQLEVLRVQKDIEAYRSEGLKGHSGTLVINYGKEGNPNLQLQMSDKK